MDARGAKVVAALRANFVTSLSRSTDDVSSGVEEKNGGGGGGKVSLVPVKEEEDNGDRDGNIPATGWVDSASTVFSSALHNNVRGNLCNGRLEEVNGPLWTLV